MVKRPKTTHKIILYIILFFILSKEPQTKGRRLIKATPRETNNTRRKRCLVVRVYVGKKRTPRTVKSASTADEDDEKHRLLADGGEAKKREDNKNNETTTRFSPTLHLEERAETEVTVAPDKQPVDVHLHPHQSIAIEGSCGVKVTSAVVCINGYLADRPPRAVLQSFIGLVGQR